MIRINLVPPDILDEEVKKRRLVQFGIVAGFLGIIFAGFSFWHYYRGVKLDKQLAVLQAKYKTLEAIVKKVEDAESKARAVRARLEVMNSLDRARPFYPTFMTELLKHIVDGVWLDALNVSGGAGTLSLNMNATALSVRSVTNWLRTLEKSETFSGPKLGALSFKGGGATEISFSMSVAYTDPGLKKRKKGKK
ncbi:PilN domain-containing protein [Elusimicrobiota bacterium]